MGLAASVTMLLVARLIDGISGANIGAAQAYLADISPENRAKAMGLWRGLRPGIRFWSSSWRMGERHLQLCGPCSSRGLSS
jgi:MFS family permease